MPATKYQATLSKNINNQNVYIYPKSLSSLIKHNGNTTVDAELNKLNTNTERLKNIVSVDTLSEMVDTSKFYICNFRIYEFDTNTNQWTARGSLPQSTDIELNTSLDSEGMAADSKAVGDAITALENRIPNKITTAISGANFSIADNYSTMRSNGTSVSDALDDLALITSTQPHSDWDSSPINVTNVQKLRNELVTAIVDLYDIIGGQDISTTVEGYITTNINDTGNKLPTAATVKAAIPQLDTETTYTNDYNTSKDLNNAFTIGLQGYPEGVTGPDTRLQAVRVSDYIRLMNNLTYVTRDINSYLGGQSVSTTVEGYITTNINDTGNKLPTAATVKAAIGVESSARSSVEGRVSTLESTVSGMTGSMHIAKNASEMSNTKNIYILTTDNKWYYYDTGTSAWVAGGTIGGGAVDSTLSQSGAAAEAAAVGTKISGAESRISTLEDYVGSKNVTSTVEEYIVTNLSTTGTKVPTAATVKSTTDGLGTRITTLEGYVGSKSVASTVEGYIVSNITTTGTKVPTCAAVKSVTDSLGSRISTLESSSSSSNVEDYITTSLSTTGTKVPTATTVKSTTDSLGSRISTLEGYVGSKSVASTVTGYIKSNITTTGTYVPTCAAVKSVTDSLGNRITALESAAGGFTTESTESAYSSYLYVMTDASNNVLMYFDQYGDCYLTGNLHAANI